MTTELLVLPLALVVLVCGLAWLAMRQLALHRELRLLTRRHDAELAARRRAATRADWLDAALETAREGVLIVDAGMRVVHWNRRFAALNGLPDDLPREGATLASLLRLSAEAGEFGLVDVEAEVARNLSLIEQGPALFPRLRHRPDGGIVEFQLELVPGGGLLLRCTDVTSRHRAPSLAVSAAPPPAAPPRPPPPSPPPALPEPSVPPHMRRAHVLLVEDMRVNQVVTATQLRRDGHRVDIAESGADAVSLAARQPYDLVLMDLMMPGMSGYDAAMQIRNLPGPAARLPIYALTANTGDDERARCLAAGMQSMLSKPVPAAVLREVLAGVVGAGPSVTGRPAVGVPASTSTATAPSKATPLAAASPLAAVPGAAPSAGTADPLDRGRLAELRGDLPAGTLEVLCRQCLDDMAERLAELARALGEGSLAAIEAEAHALAGMASSYGLAAIERLARAILAAARAADLRTARAAAAGIEDAYAHSRTALLAWAAPAGT